MKKFSFSSFLNKYYVLKESLLATLLTLIITYVVSFIPIKFEFSKAIRQEFLGFDIYDLYYSGKNLKNTQRDTSIVLIEIEKTREAIADQVSLIRKYSPAVIGIDAVFDKEGDPLGNIKLLQAINQSDNIIFASRADIDSTTRKIKFIKNFFDEGRRFESGYINFLGNQFSVIRNYPPFYQTADSVYLAFTSAIVNNFAPGKFEKLKKRNNRTEIINYRGNLEYYPNLSKEQLTESDTTGQLESLLAGKIVLLGYFVKESPTTPLVIDDLHFSPLNVQLSGKSYPDMYGVVIHANILSMVLNGNYARQVSNRWSYFFATLLIFFFLFYMLSHYKKKQHPKHGKFLLIQFLLILLMMYIFLQVFARFQIKVPLLPIMIALVLCVELLGVYKNIALWLHKKYKYKTVFTHKHII
jgi:CHASE2 domain-containing sensor protein